MYIYVALTVNIYNFLLWTDKEQIDQKGTFCRLNIGHLYIYIHILNLYTYI